MGQAQGYLIFAGLYCREFREAVGNCENNILVNISCFTEPPHAGLMAPAVSGAPPPVHPAVRTVYSGRTAPQPPPVSGNAPERRGGQCDWGTHNRPSPTQHHTQHLVLGHVHSHTQHLVLGHVHSHTQHLVLGHVHNHTQHLVLGHVHNHTSTFCLREDSVCWWMC